MGNSIAGKRFVCISDEMLSRDDLSRTARLVYIYLLKFRNLRTGQCNPKRATLADKIGVSVATVKRALVELRQKGLIASQKHSRCNSYQVISPSCWKETPADTSAGSWMTRHDGSPMTRLYKQDGFEQEATAAAIIRDSVSVPVKQPERQNQHKTQGGPKKIADAQSNTEPAFRVLLLDRHGPLFDIDGCVAAIRKQLDKRAIEFGDFVAFDRSQTTGDVTKLNNPAGYYVSLAKALRQQVIAAAHAMAIPPEQPEVAEPPRNEKGRCALCGGPGILADGSYCACPLGRDLAALARRPVKSESSGGGVKHQCA